MKIHILFWKCTVFIFPTSAHFNALQTLCNEKGLRRCNPSLSNTRLSCLWLPRGPTFSLHVIYSRDTYSHLTNSSLAWSQGNSSWVYNTENWFQFSQEAQATLTGKSVLACHFFGIMIWEPHLSAYRNTSSSMIPYSNSTSQY